VNRAPLDLLVVGSGVAGLSATLRAAGTGGGLRTGVLTKGRLADSATAWAQGGVAAVLPGGSRSPGDSPDLHRADTMAAGGGLCDPAAVEVCITEGPGRLGELVALGARFDRDSGGRLALSREGGHSTARVVHAGGAATGAEIERALVDATTAGAAAVWERSLAVDLIVEGGRCRGVRALDPAGTTVEVRASHTLLATGGAGQLYALTTNPTQSTGDGLAMALRAGVACADVEFFQFHPTALAAPGSPRPLLSEALRGEGAVLRDGGGRRFVDELAPRDVVAAAMTARMLEQGSDHLWLDARDVERFTERFPSLAAVLAASGLDARRDWLPVAPAAHYHCGGVLTDLDGATTLPGLWAAGEVACTGLHGANRLASNSLLEGMVFGARVVEAMLGGKEGPSPTGALRPRAEGWPPGPGSSAGPVIGWSPLVCPPAKAVAAADPVKARERLQAAMTAGAGVLRTGPSLDAADRAVRQVGWVDPEGANLVTVAVAVVAAARARTESRGAHRREDCPATDPRQRLRWWLG
jgi:L-aspartate oxidase